MKKTLAIFFALLIMLSGCARMNVTTQLKRNGLMDAIIIFQTPYFTIADLAQESIVPNPKLNHSFERINNSLIYFFPSINPSKSSLFLNSSENPELALNLEGFMSNDSFKYEKEFRFPFYYYKIIINLSDSRIIADDKIDKDALLEYAKDFEMNYDMIHFGQLIYTNGENLGNNKIRFNAAQPNEYLLEFREFFIKNWALSALE